MGARFVYEMSRICAYFDAVETSQKLSSRTPQGVHLEGFSVPYMEKLVPA